MMNDEARRDICKEFGKAVNMSAGEMDEWLGTEESQSVGDTAGEDESTGHEMGRHIVELAGTKADDLGEEDLKRMRKVTGYVHRHLSQRPQGDVTDTRWRWSLMNWGHDPLK